MSTRKCRARLKGTLVLMLLAGSASAQTRNWTDLKILPWVELNNSSQSDLDDVAEGLRIWMRVTDTAIVSTAPGHHDIYPRLREKVPEMRIIPGIKTSNRLDRIDSLAGWRQLAVDIEEIVEAADESYCVLENETVLKNYIRQGYTINLGLLRRGLQLLPQNVEYIWHSTIGSGPPENQDKREAVCRVAVEVLDAWLEDVSKSGPRLVNKRDRLESRRRLEALTPKLISKLNCYGPGSQWWMDEDIPYAMGLLEDESVILYPGTDRWVEAAESITTVLLEAGWNQPPGGGGGGGQLPNKRGEEPVTQGEDPVNQGGNPGPASGEPGRRSPAGGYGIFVEAPAAAAVGGSIYDTVRADPNVAGVQASFTWAELEPRKGRFDWRVLDDLLEQYDQAGKKVAVAVSAVSGEMKGTLGSGILSGAIVHQNLATPEWLLDDVRVRLVGDVVSAYGAVPRYPLFWDEAYLDHLSDFIAALAQRYDGDPRLEYFLMGGWQVGVGAPNLYAGATRHVTRQLDDYGLHVELDRGGGFVLDADTPYADAVLDCVDIWLTHFKQTSLAASVHLDGQGGSLQTAMNGYCAEAGVVLVAADVRQQDAARARTLLRGFVDEYGGTVGWTGISRFGQWRRGLSQEELLDELVNEALGLPDDPYYGPPSGVNYLVVGADALAYGDVLDRAALRLGAPERLGTPVYAGLDP